MSGEDDGDEYDEEDFDEDFDIEGNANSDVAAEDDGCVEQRKSMPRFSNEEDAFDKIERRRADEQLKSGDVGEKTAAQESLAEAVDSCDRRDAETHEEFAEEQENAQIYEEDLFVSRTTAEIASHIRSEDSVELVQGEGPQAEHEEDDYASSKVEHVDDFESSDNTDASTSRQEAMVLTEEGTTWEQVEHLANEVVEDRLKDQLTSESVARDTIGRPLIKTASLESESWDGNSQAGEGMDMKSAEQPHHSSEYSITVQDLEGHSNVCTNYVPSSTKTTPPPTRIRSESDSVDIWIPVGSMSESMPSNNTAAFVSALRERGAHVRPSSDPGGMREVGSSFQDLGSTFLTRSRTLQVPDDILTSALQKFEKEQQKKNVKSSGTHKIRKTNFASRGPRVRKSLRRIVPETEPEKEKVMEENQPLDTETKIENPAPNVIVQVQEDIPLPQMPKEEPVIYMNIHKAQLQPSRDKLNGLLWNFEGAESKDEVEARLRLTKTKRKAEVRREADKFLHMMKEKGGGSVTVAWRRHFDSDGDGELSFLEFCNALADLKYEVDTIELWEQFGGGHGHKHVNLEVLDPHGASILSFFSNWCRAEKGGPLEVFKEMDADGSDSLEPHEFSEGLVNLGFFDAEDLPDSVDSEEKVMQNLYPLLDKNGHGCIQPEQMLFLEQDHRKRELLAREIQRARDFGIDSSCAWDVSNDAHKILHDTTMGCTQLGGKFWKMIPENNHCGSIGTGSSYSTPSHRGPSPTQLSKTSTQSTPKARRIQNKSHSHTGAVREVDVVSNPSPALSKSVSLPQLPINGTRAKLTAIKQNNAGIRLRSTQKMRGARSIYGAALSSLPAVSNQHDRSTKSVMLADFSRGHAGSSYVSSRSNDIFDPKMSAPMDFFSSHKARAIFDRYYA